MTLYRLAGNECFRTLSNLFGVGRSTACVITNQVCQAIVTELAPRHIKMPSGDDLMIVIERFKQIGHGFPQVGGAIDGTHIPIISPTHSPDCYYNRKGFHSIIMQAVVDSFLKFTDVCVGWPGRVHDARVLANSHIFNIAERFQTAYPGSDVAILGDTEIPVLLLGDPAYPLKRWLMKAYPETPGMRREAREFNYKLSCCRILVERAFGLLKGRWRILLHQQEGHLGNIQAVVIACCVLHNFCLVHNEVFDGYDLQEIRHDYATRGHAESRDAASDIRDTIRDFLHRIA